MQYEHFQALFSFIEPANVLAVILFICIILIDFPKSPVFKTAKSVAGIVAFLLLFIPSANIGQHAIRPLENAATPNLTPESKVDGIILLTGDENEAVSENRGHYVSGYAAQRHIHFARLAKVFPNAKLVVTGSSGPSYLKHEVSIKNIVKNDLLVMGIDVSKVIFEDEATNTHENAMFSYNLAHPKEGEVWAVVTSAYHMPRALLAFEKEGWNVTPAPSDYFTTSTFSWKYPISLSYQLRLLSLAMHEYIGIVTYRILGWTKKLWV